MKVLAAAPGSLPFEELHVLRTRRGLELVRIDARGRAASLGFDLAEIEPLLDLLEVVRAEIEVEQRAAAAGTRTPGPPVVNLRDEYGLEEGSGR